MGEATKPLVSVLVPICNVERYLEQCLESVMKQTFKDIEVICINDGSTDGSLDIINSFVKKDSRFHVIDKPNSGYGDSMNKGLDVANGKYIAILESDDYVDPDALEYMVGRAEREQLEVLKCNFWLYWSAPGPERLNRHDVYFSAISPTMELMGPHCPAKCPEIFWAKPSIWSALYRRSFLEANDIRFLPTPGASFQDTSFTFKVFACAQRVAYSSRAFLHYRQDNEKSSVNNPGKVYCVCDEHAEIKRFLDEDRPDLKAELDPIRAKVKFYNYRWNYFRLVDDLRADFLARFSAEMRDELEAGNVKVCRNEMYHYGFAPEEESEICEIANDPEFFSARARCAAGGGKLSTLRTYYRAGGLSYVTRVLLEKLRLR